MLSCLAWQVPASMSQRGAPPLKALPSMQSGRRLLSSAPERSALRTSPAPLLSSRRTLLRRTPQWRWRPHSGPGRCSLSEGPATPPWPSSAGRMGSPRRTRRRPLACSARSRPASPPPSPRRTTPTTFRIPQRLWAEPPPRRPLPLLSHATTSTGRP